MPNPSKIPVGTKPSVVLIEEYQAIAVAFRAALERAAPDFDVRVYSSLHEAEAAMAQRAAELVIVDVDPPHRGTIGFFQTLKANSPETRALIIAPQMVPEVGAAFAGIHAFHFIKKPFELRDFASVVKRLLPNSVALSDSVSGTLANLTLVDLILLQAGSGATTVLTAEAPDGRSGEIHLADGRICHAVLLEQMGMDALQEMLGWSDAHFDEMDRRTDAPRTIKGDWKSVLLRGRQAAQITGPTTGKAATVPRANHAADQRRKRLVVVDDTEMLLVFLKEILATANPPLESITAKSGLEGFELTAEMKPDLVLLDYSLPDITGNEVCRRLLDDPRTAGVPVIMMSGHETEMVAAFEEYDNVVATIAKPFLSTSLIELVERTVADLPRLAARPRKRKKTARRPNEKPGRAHNSATDESRNGKTKQEAAPAPEFPVLPETQLMSGPTHGSLASQPAPPPLQTPGAPSEPPPERSENPPPVPPSTEKSRDPGSRPPPTALAERPSGERRIASAAPELPAGRPHELDAVPGSGSGFVPVAIHAAKYNSVVLHLPLEVVSLRFSPSLRITAIRARPSSQLVSLHMLAPSIAGAVITQAGFEIARVDLDPRGQLDTVCLTPARQPIPTPEPGSEIPVQQLVVLSADIGRTVELTPTPAAPMQMQLLVSLELCSVELSPEFGLAQLLLKSRGGEMRVQLQPNVAESGVTFESAQVLLDRSAQIAEVLLDTLV